MNGRKPKILLTNDDGVSAPGILHLWKSLADFSDLTVVAPYSEQSATSLSISIRDPLRLQAVEWPKARSIWKVNGTPADCIKLALNVVMDSPPDIILSGINRGNNSGRNLLYSGTVAGVIEGVLHDIPGIAFSSVDYQNPCFEKARTYVPSIVKFALENPLPKGTLLNVNIPSHLPDGVKGFKLTRQGKEYWAEDPEERITPLEGEKYYWLGAKIANFDEHEESDVYWLRQGFLTAAPIHISELTDHSVLSEKKEHFENLYKR